MDSTKGNDIAGMLGSAAEDIDSSLGEIMGGGSIESIGDGLVKFLSPEEIFERIFGMSRGALGSALELLCLLMGLLVLCCVCMRICESMSGGALERGVSFLGSAVLIAGVLHASMQTLEVAEEFFSRLGSLMGATIPIMGTVLAMGGNVSSATVGTATLYAMMAFVEHLCAETVLPVCAVMGATAICSGLSGGMLLEGFCGAVKKIYNFILGLIMTVFVFVLGSQTVLTASADTVAARSGKFLSSVMIPGVGGALGETVRTLAGGVSYIKSVVGIGGILLLALLTLPFLLTLMLTRLVFLVTGTVAAMLGCGRESRLLSELGNIYGLLVGAVSICSVAFAIAMAIFIRCTVAIG